MLALPHLTDKIMARDHTRDQQHPARNVIGSAGTLRDATVSALPQ
jgi:hypothetical protein